MVRAVSIESASSRVQAPSAYKNILLTSVSKTWRPSAGAEIAILCAEVIRGIKKPLVVEETSRAAEVSIKPRPILNGTKVPPKLLDL
jgi:hypothetical protein